jgi:C-terminal processing protease CtpA/Prc
LRFLVGTPVDGLLGYSFLRRYRVGIDYPRRVLWLDPLPEPWDDRPYEYSQVGLQLERRGAAIQVVGVANGSPAALAEIMIGDTLVAIDGTSAKQADLAMLTRRLEGPPGTGVSLLMRHGGEVRSYSLVRRRLL